MPNLIEGIQAEQKRVRELRKEYEKLPGNAGELGLWLIDLALDFSDKAIAGGDVVKMILAYQKLQDITG